MFSTGEGSFVPQGEIVKMHISLRHIVGYLIIRFLTQTFIKAYALTLCYDDTSCRYILMSLLYNQDEFGF